MLSLDISKARLLEPAVKLGLRELSMQYGALPIYWKDRLKNIKECLFGKMHEKLLRETLKRVCL